jgi:hypothetical protein
LAKPANRHYFCGPEQVERVRQWRAQHPGYWRRSALTNSALQDDCLAQPVAALPDSRDLMPAALQDDLLKQPTVLLGLVANLTGQTLQEDIALTLRQYHTRGQQILGLTPGNFFTGGLNSKGSHPCILDCG